MEPFIEVIQQLEMKKRVLVLGAAVIDMIVQVDQLPKSGEDMSADHKETIVGGCAYNVSHTLKQLHMEHDLIVPVGKGSFADIIKKQLTEDGYEIFVEDDRHDNGWCLSIVEKDGERSFITIAGLETNWQKEWLESISIGDYDLIYVSGYEIEGSGDIILQALEKKKASCKIIFDPSPRVGFIDPVTLVKLLSMGTIVHLNQTELKTLTNENDLQKALKSTFDITGEPVVVTLGSEGTMYYMGGKCEWLPSKKVNVIDTIGAGDSHTGAFLAGLAAELSISVSCALGNEVARIVVQQQGGKIAL